MSVIHTYMIIAHKEGPYLEDCTKSIKAQESYIDGQSKIQFFTTHPNNHMAELCEKYSMEQFVGQTAGVGNNWNEAMEHIDTKYATIVHQDDTYYPNFGTETLKAFLADESLNMVFTDVDEIDPEGKLRPRNKNLKIKSFALRWMALNKSHWWKRRSMALGNFITCPAVSYDWDKMRANNFKFENVFGFTTDWDAWMQIIEMPGHVKYLSSKLMSHRINPESGTSQHTASNRRVEEETAMFSRYWSKGMTKFIMKFYVKNQKANDL